MGHGIGRARTFSPRRGASPRTTAATSTSLPAVEGDFDADAPSYAIPSSVKEAQERIAEKARLRSFYKFTGPRTIRGTVLASFAGTIRAMVQLVDTPGGHRQRTMGGHTLPRAVIGMVPLMMGNPFIVGINQIYDKDIDELKKPFLPAESAEMSKSAAWTAAGFCGAVGPAIV